MNDHRVIARNYIADAENRIHSDDIARRFGFKGALVAGVAVYGHLTWPLVRRFGADWLGRSISHLRLIKPAYDGENLTIHLEESGSDQLATCRNETGELLAELRSNMPDVMPAPEEHRELLDTPKPSGRVEIAWDSIVPLQPFPSWHWQVTEDLNQTYARQVADDQRVFHEAAHPHLLLAMANQALVREYVMPAWIHVGSEIRMHRMLRVNETVQVDAMPLKRWERKGHQFIRLYVRYSRDKAVTTEIFHTAIFKVAG